METSPANRLPEADSLPDGFVEVSADPPSPPSSDYKDALLDLHPFGEQLVASPAETLTTDFLVDGTEKLDISGDFLTRGDNVGDGPDSVARDGILESKPGDDVSKELSAPQNEVLIGACLQGRAQGDGRNCETGERSLFYLLSSGYFLFGFLSVYLARFSPCYISCIYGR